VLAPEPVFIPSQLIARSGVDGKSVGTKTVAGRPSLSSMGSPRSSTERSASSKVTTTVLRDGGSETTSRNVAPR
jgi:hypothetical protein